MDKKIFTAALFTYFGFSTLAYAAGGAGLTDAVPILPNSSLSLNFDNPDNDTDYFKIDLLTPTDLTVSIYFSHGSTGIEILNSEGNLIASGGYNDYDASAYLEQGSYYIKTYRSSCDSYFSCDSAYKLFISVGYAPSNLLPIQDESLIDTRTASYQWTMVDGRWGNKIPIERFTKRVG
jgi:hypothetical protein